MMNVKNRIDIRRSISTRLLRIVFGFYLVIAVTVTLGHMIMEYRYQKNSIGRDLKDIQKTFERSLAITMWQLNQETLRTTLEGMLEIPVIAGVKIQDANGADLAVGGVIARDGAVGNVERRVNILGLRREEAAIHDDEAYRFDVFQHRFPIVYRGDKETKQLGSATIYSNTSVVFRRVKLGYLLLVVNAGVKTAALWLIFLWFSTVLLRRPLAALASEAEKVTLENLDSFRVNIRTSGRNELKILEESFNSMIGNLHRSMVERERAERELRRLRNYLANIIDSMPSLLVGVDPDGVVTQWNQGAERETGLSSREAVGRPLGETIPRLTSEAERIRKAIRTCREQAPRRRSRLEDGERVYEDVTVYPLVANGVDGAVIRVDDVTERVRIEEMMVQSEKMLSVGGLAAGMAHEINNPLAGMLQTASVLVNRLTGDLPANARAAERAGVTMEGLRAFMEARGVPKMLGRLSEAGSRAAEIVSNMLSFARKSDAAVSSHDLAGLLDKCVELSSVDYDLKKKYDFRQIEISRAYEENVPVVPCDAGKIQQVIMNILRNGAEAMFEEKAKWKEEGGKNRGVKTHRFTLRLSCDPPSPELRRSGASPGMVRMEIEDNGPGMDEAVRKRIFEPFFTTKPIDRGTGLGLSVSYFIITENHNGEMAVQSTPDVGTRFVIKLPLGDVGA